MAFGDRFENVFTRLDPAHRAAPDAAQVRDAFESALRVLGGLGGGGTLYVPPFPGARGVVRVSVAPDRGPLVIPENVELRVAPGVRLLPVEPHPERRPPRALAAGLVIRGAFRAPVGPVFTTLERLVDDDPVGAWEHDLGSVRFASRAMARVHPEWWGATGRGDTDDSAALEAAVRAALADRWDEERPGERRWLRPLAVELLGTYGLTRSLAVSGAARPEGQRAGVEFQGAPGGPATPSLRWLEGALPSPVPMVAVTDVESGTFDEVRFEGGGGAFACLTFDNEAPDAPARGHLLRRCGFRGAWSELVRVTLTAPAGDGPLAGLYRHELRVEGCRFEPGIAEAQLPTALAVTAPATVDVEVQGSAFEGRALAMIHARGGSLSLSSCQFDNRAGLTHGPAARTADPDDLHRDGPQGGLDVFLDRDGDGPAATLYAQDCRSTSRQFLATCREAPPGSGRDSTLVALHHVRGDVTEAPFTGIWLRPPPVIDVIPPDPAGFTKANAVKSPTAPAKAVDLTTKSSPGPVKVAPKPVFDAELLAPVAKKDMEDGTAETGPTLPERWIVPDREGWRLPRPSAIDWRLPLVSGARLVLIGCRFDWSDPSGRAAVRGFPLTSIADLGAFNGRGDGAPVVAVDGHTTDAPRLLTVPRLADIG